METVYTVSEDVGSMDVCVNLTQPQVDILEEYVVVEVIDFPSSVYIPGDATLASELLLVCMCMYTCIFIMQQSQLTFVCTSTSPEALTTHI